MIENEQSIARYTGNGTVKEFSIPFSFYKNADGAPETYQVAVYQRDVGAKEKKLDQETDYQVTWDEESRKGSITLTSPLPDQSILAIVREIPPTQEVEYEENAPFPYDGTNTALDKLTMLVQQQGEEMSRKLGVTPTYDKTAEETMADVVDAKESADLAAERAKASATEANASADSALNSANLAKQYSDSASAGADKAQEQAGAAALSKQGADEALAQLNNQVTLAEQAAQAADDAKSAAQASASSASDSASSAFDSSNTATEQATAATDAQKEATRASISCAVNEQRTLSYYNEVKRLAEVFKADPATDTTYGFTRFATEAEADAGELNNVSSTPAQVKKASDKALASSKSYTDTKSAESKTYTDGQTLVAKKYADSVVSSHAGRTDNPHNVTKAQLGLRFVDNTADMDKPISSAAQQALDTKASKTDVSASLSTKADLVDGKVPESQLPSQVVDVAKKDLSNVTTIADGSAVKTALGAKVNKEGDTMSGKLELGAGAKLNNGQLEIVAGRAIILYKKDGVGHININVSSSDDLLRIFDETNKGIFLEKATGYKPNYYDGSKAYPLVYLKDSFSDAQGNWYRVWSNNTIEQGGFGTNQEGIVTITFLKPFKDDKYTFVCSGSMGFEEKTTTGISFDPNFGNGIKNNVNWYAIGKGA